jgi:hypothetical protein
MSGRRHRSRREPYSPRLEADIERALRASLRYDVPPALAWMSSGDGLFISTPDVRDDEWREGPWGALMRYARPSTIYLLPDNVERPTRENIDQLSDQIGRLFSKERRIVELLNYDRHERAFINAALAYRAETRAREEEEDE